MSVPYLLKLRENSKVKDNTGNMDLHEMKIKKEEVTLEIEDANENYLKLDFEIGVKVENESPVFDDWCLQNSIYQDHIVSEAVKKECDVKTCFLCFRIFEDSYSLYKHNITHMVVVLKQPSLYQCNYCFCYFTSKVKIGEHIQTKHYLKLRKQHGLVSQQEHLCLICKKMYTYKRWHAHMKEVHGTEKLKCADCDVTFKCLSYLRRHLMYVHENVRPSWRFHNVKVDPVQKINCELCPSIFQNRSSYKAHLRNCHSTEVHECTLCHSKLKSKSYLLTHMKRVHYNDGKVHKCNICCKVFRSPRYLNIHKKNSHDVRIKSKKFDRRRIYPVESSVT